MSVTYGVADRASAPAVPFYEDTHHFYPLASHQLKVLKQSEYAMQKKRHFKASGKVCAHGVYVCVKLNKKQAFSTCLLAHDKFTIKSSKDAPGVATIKRTNYIEMQTSQ